MVKLRINNRDFEVSDGVTILDVALDAGYRIPTMCHKNGLPHYSSCMVCMVKDNRSNSFMPSCSALVQDGMDIDISTDEVISLRKKAIELLLSEHRAECEAPCRVVCPAGYNIPLMNRILVEGDFEKAIGLSRSELNTDEIACTSCPGYCENACRRKKVDIPVSIRNMHLLVSQSIVQDEPVQMMVDKHHNNDKVIVDRPKKEKLSKRFSSHIGKLEETELQEWLKECSGRIIRSREISDFYS